jgi:diguanylate cyclase (GGDEF)-like protein
MFDAAAKLMSHHRAPVLWRLAAIVALLLFAQVVVVIIGTRGLGDLTKANENLSDASRGQYYQQNTDMMHDSVRSSVLSVMLSLERGTDSRGAVEGLRTDALQMRRDIRELEKLELGETTAKSLEKTRPQIEIYLRAADEIVQLAATDPATARERLPAFERAWDELRATLEVQTSTIERLIAETRQESVALAASAHRNILITSTSLIVLAGFLSWLLARSIQLSLREVSETARAMADGDLDVRSRVDSRDELGATARAINRMATSLRELIGKLRADAERDAFGTQLVEALEMSDTEPETHTVVARAMGAIAADRPMELLLADSSRANLERAAQHPTAGSPGCGVESPFSCVAVRRGNPVSFENSEALNACPRLRGRGDVPLSAVCVPVSFMGRSLGVLHASGPANDLPTLEQIRHLTTLGIQAGSRIGTVRAFERTQHQAATDALTGLANRRTLEEAARQLISTTATFALIMIDLDHFKRLNDTFGHEAGDEALRIFADVLRHVFRAEDHPARWGGEEFCVIVTGATAADAAKVIDRLRAQLAERLLTGGSRVYTASFGIADTGMSRHLEHLVRIADDALYTAKEAGRDRCIIGDAARVKAGVPRRDSEQPAAIDVAALVRSI